MKKRSPPGSQKSGPNRSTRRPQRSPFQSATPQAEHSDRTLRIIAGQLKGRKIQFPATPGLRPTGDRIRETLFNWLTPILPQARCLDLFSGSGILGLEALSRGAKEVTFVEQNQIACQQIMAHILEFKLEKSCKLFSSAAIDFLSHGSQMPYDIVFLDPPFESDLISVCSQYLEQRNLLKKPAYIYLETDKKLLYPPIPGTWKLIHSQFAGQVAFHLAKRT